jgi:hypothetical protein
MTPTEEAELAALSAARSLADEQHCHEAATCAAVLAGLALAKERRCHGLAMITAMSAEKSHANEQRCQEAAKQAALLAEQALAREQLCHKKAELAAISAATALANKQHHHEVAACAAALVELALAKDQGCHKTVVMRAGDKCNTMPADPPNIVDAAIRRICVKFNLLAASLDTILAKIECKDIAQDALAFPTRTLPPPMVILPSPLRPTSYLGAVLSTMGGNPVSLDLPSPTVDGHLQTVHQSAGPCCPTGQRNRPGAPSSQEEGTPSHPNQMLGGAPTPTTSLTALA